MIAKVSNSFWSVLEFFCYPFLVVISTPYFLKTLGPESYGHWMLLTAVVGFGGFIGVGTSAASIRQISQAMGGARAKEIEMTVKGLLGIALLAGAVAAMSVTLVFWFAGDLIWKKMGGGPLIYLTGGFASLLICLDQIDSVLGATLKGAERFRQSAVCESGTRAIQIVAAMGAVAVWGGLTGLYVSLVVTACLRLLIKSLVVKHELALGSLSPTLANAKGVLQDASWGWVQGAGGLFFSVADRLLVGSLFGAASLARYAIASQVALLIHSIPAAGLGVLFPAISRAKQARENSSIRTAIRRAMIVNVAISGTLALSLFFLGGRALSLWLGEAEGRECASILKYLTVGYLLLGLNVVPHFALLGLGHFRFVAFSNLFAAVASVIAMLALSESRGVIGIALARIVYGVLIFVNFLPLYRYRMANSGEERC